MSVRVKNVSVPNPSQPKAYPLVKDISCEVMPGEVLAIIGPNGAGKSSLLRAIAGEWSFSGEIEIDGLVERAVDRARQFAVLPQFSLLNFSYRVSEVVELSRIPHQTGSAIDMEIVAEALALMDISYLHDRLYTELSGGEKQRVQLARVLAQIWRAEDAANQTRVLLLDEPTTALDLGHQHDLLKAVREIANQGVAVIIVLHDINLAARYADCLLALLCSQTLAFGSPKEVVTAANIEQLFGVSVNIISHPVTGCPVVLPQ
jgi:iron complex transport system ATP-binding protein